MRVLLVNDLPPGPTGGAEVHVGRLGAALRAAGDEVELLHAEGEKRGPSRALDLWDPRARHRMRDVLVRFAPDVVHFHNLLNELSTSVVGLGTPSVLTVHDPRLLGIATGLDHGRSVLAPSALARRAKARLARGRLRRAVDATIAPSAALADALVQARFPNVHHVANFATTVSPSPPGSDVVFVGGLTTYKGPHVLVEAFARIAERHPAARLHVAGDGPLRSSLRAQVHALALDDRVQLHGPLPPEAVPALIARAALVVVPSTGPEGGGPTLSVIEAMAGGRAVVASDEPGVREGVDDTVGTLVPSGDPEVLAATLDQLLGDPERLGRMGEAARSRARERWSPEAAVERIRGIYRDVAGG